MRVVHRTSHHRRRASTVVPRVVLGLCSGTHDSAAALLVDGELRGFAEEERLTGDKHTRDFPQQTIDWLLRDADIDTTSIDAVAYNFRPTGYLHAVAQVPGQLLGGATRRRVVPRVRSFVRVAALTRGRLRDLERRFPQAAVTAVPHHRAHGLYAFGSSGYDDAAVLVVDSLGEIQSTTTAHSRRTGTKIDHRLVDEIDDPASLGYAYGALTEHLGWRRGDEEGTVMALAALGDPSRFRDVVTRAIPLTATGFVLNPRLLALRVLSSRYVRVTEEFVAATCPPRQPADPVAQVHADLAAALQERTEEVLLTLARRARTLTGSPRLCLGGGVAANCVAVGEIVEAGLFDEVHVPPAPGDSGTAIGTAAAVHVDRVGQLPNNLVGRCYLGPSFAGMTLDPVPRPGLTAHRPADPARLLAHRLAEGRIVGLFRGPLEAGPRALGNRSILASPLLPGVVERLNATVKFREPFRPFAPIVPDHAADEYFTLTQRSPFMSIASGVTDLARDRIIPVVHTNGTARVQTLAEGANPFLSTVLAEFAALTGVPVLINTSLNVKGKPICGTPDMALDCLVDSGLDALLIEGWWVQR